MASLIKVLDLYNSVATATGFPQYTNETDTPDTTRFLLEILSEALHSVIDALNTNNATFQVVNYITTIDGEDTYSIAGIVKHIELLKSDGTVIRIPYNNREDFMRTKSIHEAKSMPRCYVINRGQVRLFPTPDKPYTLKLILSSDDLILSDNDTYQSDIRDINDSIIGITAFGNLIKSRAIALIFTRCGNKLASYYNQMTQERLKTYLEQTGATVESVRTVDRNVGHFNVRRGLLG